MYSVHSHDNHGLVYFRCVGGGNPSDFCGSYRCCWKCIHLFGVDDGRDRHERAVGVDIHVVSSDLDFTKC